MARLAISVSPWERPIECRHCGTTGFARWNIDDQTHEHSLGKLNGDFVNIGVGLQDIHYFSCAKCPRLATNRWDNFIEPRPHRE